MINKNTIVFFLFLFAVLYYISPNNVETNESPTNNKSKPNKELVCKNIENIENALNNVLDMVKGLCHKGSVDNYSSNLKEQFDDKLEREVLAKKYLKKKLKETFKDVVKVNMPKDNPRQVQVEQSPDFNQSMTSAGFSEYTPDFRDDNVLNPY